MARAARPIENHSTNEISSTVRLGIPVKLNAALRSALFPRAHPPNRRKRAKELEQMTGPQRDRGWLPNERMKARQKTNGAGGNPPRRRAAKEIAPL